MFYFMPVDSKVILGSNSQNSLICGSGYLEVAHRTVFDDEKSVRLKK